MASLLPWWERISSTIRSANGPPFCGRRRGVAAKPPKVTVSCSSNTTKGLCDRPLETFARPLPVIVRSPTLVGHGGSISRRDHNQAYRRRTPLSGGTKPEEAITQNASRSSGAGVWGGGASLREAASSPESPQRNLFGREREGGDFSTEKSPPSQILL